MKLSNEQAKKISDNFQSFDLLKYGDLQQCMRCSFCLSTCPTYKTDAIETESPRGRVALIKAVYDKLLMPSDRFIQHMYDCLDCRACQTICPAGVKPGELALEARERIESELPQTLLKKFILHKVLKSRKKIDIFVKPLSFFQKTKLSQLIKKYDILKWIAGESISEGYKILPNLSGKSFLKTTPEILNSYGREKYKIAFFVGCAMNVVFPEVTYSSVEALRKLGCTIIIPHAQQCCGAPNIEEGEREAYREMAKFNIGLFGGIDSVDAIVTDCAACGSELKNYQKMFTNTEYNFKSAEFSKKIKDFSEFAAPILNEKDLSPVNLEITYDDPCHLCHAQGIKSAPREILNMIPGINCNELENSDQCCGSAGIYSITHYDRSMKILKDKVNKINKTNADIVVTANPGCLMQITYGVNRWSKGKTVMHISEIVNKSLKK